MSQSIRPEQGSYGQFQLETGQSEPPYKPNKDILAKLKDSIPQDETQWQQLRQSRGYATAEDILQKTREILENRIVKQDLRNFISIATCCIDWHLGRKTKAYETFKSQVGPATELTIQKYMSSVRGVVQLLDPVYRGGLRHRAFEATFLYARIGPSFLPYYNKDASKFTACFPAPSCLGPEIQASLPLSIAFIVKYRHCQEYSYRDICKALGTYVLDEAAYAKFTLTLENGKPVPCVLHCPERVGPLSPDQHEPSSLEPNEVCSGDVATSEEFQLPDTFRLKFKIFKTSDTLRQKMKELQEQSYDRLLREVLGAPLKELDWTVQHDTVADQTISDLIQGGILPRKALRREKSFYQHDPGSVAVPSGWIKIILPFRVVSEVHGISVIGTDFETSITWSHSQGFVLGEGVLLFTSQRLFYLSISIPLPRHA